MPNLTIRCGRCLRTFASGISVAPGVRVTLVGNVSLCPYCGSAEAIPDGTFRATISDFVQLLADSTDPLSEAQQILEDLAPIRSADDLVRTKKRSSVIAKWLPDSPEKIAAYIAIVTAAIAVLKLSERITVDNRTTIVNQIHVTVDKRAQVTAPLPTNPKTQPEAETASRNRPCPCGSGKKYKKCHGTK